MKGTKEKGLGRELGMKEEGKLNKVGGRKEVKKVEKRTRIWFQRCEGIKENRI